MLIKLIKDKIVHPNKTVVAFADTCFEFEELYNYLNEIQKFIQERFKGWENFKIEILDGLKVEDFDKWRLGKSTRGASKGKIRGMPLRRFPCYWTRESKVKQLHKIQKKYSDEDNVFIGIALDEKKRYSKAKNKNGMIKDGNLRYPLVEWGFTEQDCVDYLRKIKAPSNPLYANFNRLGCWMCPKQSEMSLYVLWKKYPDYWEKIKKLESEQPYEYKNIYDECDCYGSDESCIYCHGEGRILIRSIKTDKKMKVFEEYIETYEEKFKKGILPKQKPKYDCWNGCEGVKKAFQELGCGVFIELDYQEKLNKW